MARFPSLTCTLFFSFFLVINTISSKTVDGKQHHSLRGAHQKQDACCSDGNREGFINATQFPQICGCSGVWNGHLSLASPPTGKSCGGTVTCQSPADLCGYGFEPCRVSSLISLVTADQCYTSATGRYVLPFSHCLTHNGCVYNQDHDYPCMYDGWCSEPVCCGTACQFGTCGDGVWPRNTRITVRGGTDQGCGFMSSTRTNGIVCCNRTSVQCPMNTINLCTPDTTVTQCTNSMCGQYRDMADRQAKQAATSKLLQAIMFTESSCNIKSISGTGAYGLMQLLPSTANEYRDSCGINETVDGDWLVDSVNAEGSICLAAAFINQDIVAKCGNDVRNIAAAYNSGTTGCENSVSCANVVSCDPLSPTTRKWECLYDDKHQICNKGYEETRKYTRKVMQCVKLLESGH